MEMWLGLRLKINYSNLLLWQIFCFRHYWCFLTSNDYIQCLVNVVSDGLDLRPKYSGMLHCMKSVWAQEGLRGLYQGVTPNVWGAGASWGLYFLLYVLQAINLPDHVWIMVLSPALIPHTVFLCSYNAIKGYAQEGRQTELSATEHLVSAAEAG